MTQMIFSVERELTKGWENISIHGSYKVIYIYDCGLTHRLTSRGTYMFMTFAARAFSFCGIHTSYEQLSRPVSFKSLMKLSYEAFPHVLSYIWQVTLSNWKTFSAWTIINHMAIVVIVIDPFTTLGPSFLIMPICCYPSDTHIHKASTSCLASTVIFIKSTHRVM